MRETVRAAIAYLLFYPTLLWNVLLSRVFGFRHWWDFVSDDLVLGALPLRSDVSRFHELGVRFVINTCLETKGPIELYDQLGIRQLHLPTVDYAAPNLPDVMKALDFIASCHGRGIVYLHCKAGRGRSATIALCWMIQSGGLCPR